MKGIVAYVLFCQLAASLQAVKWPCDKHKAIEEFKKKKVINPWPLFENDPYKNQTDESNQVIEQYLKNRTRVCALRYIKEDKTTYELRDFGSKTEAEDAGYIVTHQGKCGACSNLKDLSVYLEKNLTKVVRACAVRLVPALIRRCLAGLGFTPSCVGIWQANAKNTRKNCFSVCMKAWILGTPNTLPDGRLNDCLQCDEDKSGPVFKYFAGRTRRNSGIVSAISRPGVQVYNMTHCYY